jgi:SAM-dependent methyltransferase
MECPICGSAERRPHAERRQACCTGCLSLERHRALVRQLAPELVPRGSARCLELAPRSRQVYGSYLTARAWRYHGADRWDIRGRVDPGAFGSFIDYDADATDLFFAAGGSYELFITQHVIEEIPDYPAALDEVARVLEPGGRALLEIPIDRARERNVRQDPDDYDNVWAFGRQLETDLNARFDRVERVVISEAEYRGSVFVCRRAA